MESIDELKDKLYQEKLDRANHRFGFRLGAAVFTFIVVLVLIANAMDQLNAIVQWVCIILYFGIGYVVFGLICKRHSQDKDDAIRLTGDDKMSTSEKLRMPEGWQLVCDPDVVMVLEFILKNIEGSKRLKVVDAVQELAGPIFRRFTEEPNWHEEKFVALTISPRLP